MTYILLVCLQVFVETLDKCFENVCELDLIFHVDKVRNTHSYIWYIYQIVILHTF